LTCGVLIPRGSYCRRHEPKRDSPGRWTGPGSRSFRSDTLAKTGGRCVVCGSTDRVEAHHIIGLREGGSNDAAVNGMPLCFDHHRGLEAERRLILGDDGAR
jgi:hypothetical protein